MTTVEQIRPGLDVAISGPVSLVVGRRVNDELEVKKLNLADDAGEDLRALCRSAVEDLDARAASVYTADTELGSEEAFLIDDPDTIAELGGLADLAASSSTLPVTSPADLDARIQLYAVVAGGTGRVVFVRKANPVVHARRGFMLAGRQELRRFDEPTFAFQTGFDLVIGDGWIVVLNQGRFEQLFKDLGIVAHHVSEWIEGITDHLPMADDSLEALALVAHRDPRTWRRLKEIKRRGHLARIGLDEVARYAGQVGLQPSDVVRDGQLIFDESQRFSFLHLLSEDLYIGPLTGERFEAQRKASAT